MSYVIVNSNNEYVGHDSASGGYPYWSRTLKGATFYNTKDEAKNALSTDTSFYKNSKMSDGKIYPPHMLGQLVGNSSLVTLDIKQIRLDTVYHWNFKYDPNEGLDPVEVEERALLAKLKAKYE